MRIAMASPCLILLIACVANPFYFTITAIILIWAFTFDVLIINPKVKRVNQRIHELQGPTVQEEE